MALWHIWDPKLVEMGIVPNDEVAKQMYRYERGIEEGGERRGGRGERRGGGGERRGGGEQRREEGRTRR